MRMQLTFIPLAFTAIAAAVAVTPVSAAKLTVTQYGRIVATLPWVVALDKGMFKEAGLPIDGIISGPGGSSSLRSLISSEFPVGEVSTSVVLNAAKTGANLKVIYAAANHIGELAWGVKPDSGINMFKDLSGKKVAYTNAKSTTEMVLRGALKKEGLTGKVEILPLGGLGPALAALNGGAVAAAPINDPRLTTHPKEHRVLFHGWQIYPKYSWLVGVTTKEFAEKYPDVVRKLVQVHRKAVDYVYAHRQETSAIYAKVWNVSQAEADAILPKYYEWQHWSAGDFSKEGLDALVESMRSAGEISGAVDWSTVIDQNFLDRDQRRPL